MSTAEPTPAEFHAWYDLQVRLADDDHYGHVNNARYYEYFDTAINGWLISAMGLSVRELPALGVVANSSCRFIREIHFPNHLKVGIRVCRIGTSSVTHAPTIFRREEGAELTLCATGRFVHVYIDPDTRRPVPIPTRVVEVVSPEMTEKPDARTIDRTSSRD